MFFLNSVQIAALADFGYGHTRAEVCCAYSNKWIFIKGLGHALLASLMILNNQVVLAFINVPMLLWTCFYKAQVGIYGKEGIYDPTEIRSRLNLCRYMRDASLQLGFYVISFFAYAYL